MIFTFSLQLSVRDVPQSVDVLAVVIVVFVVVIVYARQRLCLSSWLVECRVDEDADARDEQPRAAALTIVFRSAPIVDVANACAARLRVAARRVDGRRAF